MSCEPLADDFGRRITYLRVSVTDQCQFRCVYCMPPEGIAALPRREYMTADEMERLVRALAPMGVSRVRLTGGEPLLRPDIVDLVARLSVIDGVEDMALTTNGEYLADKIAALKAAGLHRVNISMDSLDPVRFRELTLSGSFEKVWAGVQAALTAELQVKLNAVVMKGMSNEEIDGFARLAFEHPLEVRFIEFMPLCGTGWKPELTMPIDIVRQRIATNYRLLALRRGTEVAESFEVAGGRGRVGFIGSMTEPFCSSCSRIRVSATGQVQLCLFSKVTYSLLPLLRSGAGMAELQAEIRRVVLRKPEMHPWAEGPSVVSPDSNAMIRTIGG